ncbi:MAG: hypothetical protein IJ007_09795 [Oscillospiraceae bacterium]|nr:hypothetical protein [Oscillospiraceae bacterium]
MNNESQLENSDFSDGYLLVDDTPKQNKSRRAADLYYNENDNTPLVLEELGDASPTGSFRKDPMPKLSQENAPALESIDGVEMTARATFEENEERAAQVNELNVKYSKKKTSEDFYKDKKYTDDLLFREHGEKIAKIIGIDLIAIAAIAAVNSFFTGDGMEFVVSLMKIAFTVLFMKGYKVARWFLIFSVTISVYGPFMLLFVSEQQKSPLDMIIYPIVLIMYVLIDILLIASRDIKEFSTKTFF